MICIWLSINEYELICYVVLISIVENEGVICTNDSLYNHVIVAANSGFLINEAGVHVR